MAGYVGLERTSGISTANNPVTVSAGGGAAGANDGVRRRVKYVTVAYSAAPTQTGVTMTVNSGVGAGYDTLIIGGSANIRYTYYEPENLVLLGDDTLDVIAPAAGGVITASIVIVCEGYYGE